MNPHYQALAMTKAAVPVGLLSRAGGWLASKLAPRAGGWLASKLAPRAAAAGTQVVPQAVEAGAAQVAKTPGVLDHVGKFLDWGPGNAMQYAGKKFKSQRLTDAGNWATGKLGQKYEALPKFMHGWTPQSIGSYGGLGGMVAGVPGAEAFNTVMMPGFSAAYGAAGLGANAVKGVRMADPANQAAFASDVQSGGQNAAFNLMAAAQEDPRLFNAEYLNQQLGPELQGQMQNARAGTAPVKGGTWDNIKRFVGMGDGDFATSLAMPQAYGQIGQTLNKSAGLWDTAGKLLIPAMATAPLIGGFFGKPYDETKAQEAGTAAGAAGFTDAVSKLNPIERFMAQHVDPSLAVAAADKAKPGFAKNYADWYQQQTGKKFGYGALGSMYGSMSSAPGAPTPGKFYVNSSLNTPAYLA